MLAEILWHQVGKEHIMTCIPSSRPLESFIAVTPPPLEKKPRSCPPRPPRKPSASPQRRIYHYIDLFGVLYAFSSQKDRDTFLSWYPEAKIPPHWYTRTQRCLPRYPYVVVCRSLDDMERLLMKWMCGGGNYLLYPNNLLLNPEEKRRVNELLYQ